MKNVKLTNGTRWVTFTLSATTATMQNSLGESATMSIYEAESRMIILNRNGWHAE